MTVGAFATTGAPKVATAVLAVELVPLPIAFTARTTTWKEVFEVNPVMLKVPDMSAAAAKVDQLE